MRPWGAHSTTVSAAEEQRARWLHAIGKGVEVLTYLIAYTGSRSQSILPCPALPCPERYALPCSC